MRPALLALLVVPVAALAPLVGAAPDPGCGETGAAAVPQVCTGIRPGSKVRAAAGVCTAGFVFRDADLRLYFATAGHCFRGAGVGARVGVESVTDVGVTEEVGTLVFAVDEGVGRDAALVRVDAGYAGLVDPSVCHWGGPTASSGAGTEVRYYGQGVGAGTLVFTRPRLGVAAAYGPEAFSFVGATGPGDSGAPVLSADGGAAGVFTALRAASATDPASSGRQMGTSLARLEALAEAGTGLDLELQTAPGP